MSEEATAAGVYSDLILEQLAEERSRKTSLEQRGMYVITSSAALVTLLFGLVAAITAQKDFVLPYDARCYLAWGLVFFLLAAILGLITNAPVVYSEPTPDSLQEMIDDDQLANESTIDATVTASDARLQTLRSYRKKNGRKAWVLLGGFGAEALAAASVAKAVHRILG